MKITCSRESLLENINIVSKAVSNRTTLPILECILLKANEQGFRLTANDLEIGIESAPIESTIEEEGNIALEAKMFSEIIRRVNGESVFINTDERNTAIISCGNSEFKIMGQSGEEFPELPIVEKNNEYVISQIDLRNMIKQTIFSISQDESKQILMGELIEINDNSITMVSVDGYRISLKKSEISKASKNINVIVPGKTLNEISKILSAEPNEKAYIYFTDKHILLDIGGNMVVSRIIEGEFIKYSQSFNEDYKTKIYVNRTNLISSFERASLISKDSRKTPVKIEIQSNKIILTSNTEMGTTYDEVDVETEGDTLKIAFNPRYLIEALRVIEDEIVSIQFTTSLSPCIIKPVEGSDYKYLILPLRI